jgi:hypothetical protein
MDDFVKYALAGLGGVQVVVTCLMGVLAAVYKAHIDRQLVSMKTTADAALAGLQSEFAEKLARSSGEIRERVESNLKQQESRLRMMADIQLRLHARQMEDFSTCRWKATHARLRVDRFLIQHHRGAGHDGLKPMASVEDAIADAMGSAVLVPPRHRAPIIAYVDAFREVVFSVDEAVSAGQQADASALHSQLGKLEQAAVSSFDAWLEALSNAHESALEQLGGPSVSKA